MLLGSVSETNDEKQRKEQEGNQQLIQMSEKLYSNSRNFEKNKNKCKSYDALQRQLNKIKNEKS